MKDAITYNLLIHIIMIKFIINFGTYENFFDYFLFVDVFIVVIGWFCLPNNDKYVQLEITIKICFLYSLHIKMLFVRKICSKSMWNYELKNKNRKISVFTRNNLTHIHTRSDACNATREKNFFITLNQSNLTFLVILLEKIIILLIIIFFFGYFYIYMRFVVGFRNEHIFFHHIT